jgi:multidrug resistance efflux pump
MKMEVALKAPVDGTVSTVGVTVGEQVPLGATLFVVTPATPRDVVTDVTVAVTADDAGGAR